MPTYADSTFSNHEHHLVALLVNLAVQKSEWLMGLTRKGIVDQKPQFIPTLSLIIQNNSKVIDV